MQDNTASECIRTVAAKYGCKILQLYEYDANVFRSMRTATRCESHAKTISSCNIEDSWLPG